MFIDIEKILDEKHKIVSWNISHDEDNCGNTQICLQIEKDNFYVIHIETIEGWTEDGIKYWYKRVYIWDEKSTIYEINYQNLDLKTFEKVEKIEKLIRKRIIDHIQNTVALV